LLAGAVEIHGFMRLDLLERAQTLVCNGEGEADIHVIDGPVFMWNAVAHSARILRLMREVLSPIVRWRASVDRA